MSSKLHRGGLPIDPIAWRRATAHEQTEEIVGTYAPITTTTGAGQSFQQGFQEGQAAGREEMTAQVDAMNGRLALSLQHWLKWAAPANVQSPAESFPSMPQAGTFGE